MKASQFYRIGRVDQDGAQYLSDDVLDEVEAAGHLALEQALLIIAGWTCERCRCGRALLATKNELTRTVVAVPIEDIENYGLVVGTLAPASRNGRLEAVTV